MNPKRIVKELALQIKANGHKAQAALLDNMNGLIKLALVEDQDRQNKFANAYAAVNEISSFPVDTDPDMNGNIDTERLKRKVETAITEVTMYQVAYMGLQAGSAAKKAQFEAEMDLVEQALKFLGEAKDDAAKLQIIVSDETKSPTAAKQGESAEA